MTALDPRRDAIGRLNARPTSSPPAPPIAPTGPGVRISTIAVVMWAIITTIAAVAVAAVSAIAAIGVAAIAPARIAITPPAIVLHWPRQIRCCGRGTQSAQHRNGDGVRSGCEHDRAEQNRQSSRAPILEDCPLPCGCMDSRRSVLAQRSTPPYPDQRADQACGSRFWYRGQFSAGSDAMAVNCAA